MKFSKFFFLCVLFVLNGCAGKHNIPPKDYATNPAVNMDTVRVIFDQDGSLWPTESTDGIFSALPLSAGCRYNPFKIGCSYRLHKLDTFYDVSYQGYDFFESNHLIRAEVVKKLIKSIKETGRLVVKIHGFNNDFKAANNNFNTFDERMTELDSTVLEVYWDGLNKRLPLSIWNNALLYSNMAGQIGLRGILNRITVPYDLVFVTHSRGAAVAISAITDPINDANCSPQVSKNVNYSKLCEVYFKGIAHHANEYPRFEPFNTQYVQSIQAAMFAPAIGNGHFWSGMNRYLSDFDKVDFYLGVNKDDYATTKIYWGSAFGDTRLGNDAEMIESVKAMLATSMPNIYLQELWFESGRYHGVPDYFDSKNGTKPECMMWAVGLNTEKPDNCFLR